jgi:phosphoglycolate phosphatase
MRMAKAAHVKAIGVAWGYHEIAELKAEGADIVIERFDHLDDALDQLLGATHA